MQYSHTYLCALIMLRKVYIQLSTLMFLHYFVAGAWLVTLGTYLLYTLEFTGTQVGLVYGAQAAAAVATPFLIGVAADRYLPAERLLGGLYISSGLILAGLAFVKVFSFFFPLLILTTLLFTPTFSLGNGLCFHNLNDTEKDFPKVRVWGTVGWIASGLLVGFLQIEYSHIPLLIAMGASLVLGVFCFFLPHTPPLGKKSRFSWRDALGLDTIQLLRKPAYAVVIACLAWLTISVSFYHTFTNPFLNEVGMTNAAGKMTLGQVVEIFVIMALPFLFRRFGVKWILFTGMVVWGLRYLFFSLGVEQPWQWMLYGGILLHGLAYSFTALSAQIWIDKQVPVTMRSSVQGFIALLTMGVGRTIGSWFAGWIVDIYTFADGSHNWTVIWAIPCGIAFSAALAFILLYRKPVKS
jgi:nucleoside transporter